VDARESGGDEMRYHLRYRLLGCVDIVRKWRWMLSIISERMLDEKLLRKHMRTK